MPTLTRLALMKCHVFIMYWITTNFPGLVFDSHLQRENGRYSVYYNMYAFTDKIVYRYL